MMEKGKSLRSHPGIMKLKVPSVPEPLMQATAKVTEKFPVHNLGKKSQSLYNYFHSRKFPVEPKVLQQSAVDTYEQVVAKLSVDEKNLPPDLQEAKIKATVMKKMRAEHYHWQPIRFDAPTAIVYLQARMMQNYSIMLQCLKEISRRRPNFCPRSIYDHGSGLASTVWAGNRVWGAQIHQFYCVDTSQDMNTLARLLLQDGEEEKDMGISGVHFRQFPPSSDQNTFDLVVCAHTLMELPSQKERLDTIQSLWKMAGDYLVLVENGSVAGFKLIDEAREFLLKQQDPKLQGHVFAPCPHDKPCPKLIERNSPCMFDVKFKSDLKSDKKMSIRYSYVILQKGQRKEEDTVWPRIIQEVVKPSKHVHCHLCFPDGTISHDVLTAKKHGKDLYKCARSSNWGDLLPVCTPSKDKTQETSHTTGSAVSVDTKQQEHTSAEVHQTEDKNVSQDTQTDNQKNEGRRNTPGAPLVV